MSARTGIQYDPRDEEGAPQEPPRRERLRSLIAQVTHRRAAGETLPDGRVIEQHRDLMPELGRELGRLRTLRRAYLAARRAGPPPEPLQLLPEELLDAPIEVPPEPGPTGHPGAARPARSPAPAPAPSIHGYQLLHEVGGGGQAVVYRAVQESTGRKVAVKVVPGGPFLSSRSRARFDREVQILAALEHPNIVGVLDRGRTTDGSFYLVMEYVDGPCLDEHALHDLSPGGDRAALLRLFVKLANAVGAAHERGIVHRDLKPSNVRVDARGEPHVLDFGLARWLGKDEENLPSERLLTVAGQIVGSMPWASPEQAIGSSAAVDARGDVYALGVMLYVALTGKFPYEVFGPVREVLDNIAEARPLPPSRVADRGRGIAPALDAIVLKALAKQPQDRYATASDLAADLQRHLDGRPVLAFGPGRRLATRRRLAVCAAVVVAAAATAVGLLRG